MNKNIVKGLLAIMLVFGITVIGCDNGTTNNNNETTTYTVTFNSNGGSEVAAITGITSGSSITLPQKPTKGEDTFVGWFIDNNTWQNQFTSSTVVTDNLTVYAKWIPQTVDNKIVGKWNYFENEDRYMKLEFKEDDTGVLIATVDDGHGNYSENITNILSYGIENDKIKFIFEGEPPSEMKLDFELSDDGNSLSITGLMWDEDNNLIEITFSRIENP